jgi:cation transport ATPase
VPRGRSTRRRGRTPSGLDQVLRGSGGGIYLEVAAWLTTFQLAERLYEAKARRIAGQAMRGLAEAGAKDLRVLDDDGTRLGTRTPDIGRFFMQGLGGV